MLDQILAIINQYEEILIMLSIISGVIFVLTLLITPFLLGLIPENYFSASYVKPTQSNTLLGFIKTIVTTILGTVLLLAGIIMLVTPGQGVISILIGLFLMQFPGKRKLELKLIKHNSTFKALNWLRNKAAKPPFIR
ncbi:PGPGW domain-containing protein [Candidatus Thioglobus sp.]|uniref:PGPGW domain-containing protein n=1 Tax=Candidatus Thioglobus sp. TaxID=2026721 RepID=UPI0026348C6A|nr:PGPGW domain-containing protein [Candidatus Thioglobus sp.]MDG2395972.1 PGPGW domain-containing protein [Candidatus Thioglobus sp.]